MFRSQQIKELLYGVRFKILLLLFFTVFPLLLMILYNGYEQRHQAIKETQQRVFNIAKDVHLWQSSTFRTIYETLVSLSNDPMIASLDPGLCSRIFSQKFKMGAFPQCLNAGLIDRNGYLICSFIEPDHGLFLGDRDYFKSAIENRGFSSGGILRSRITGKNILVFAYPVLEENSEVKAVISAGFDLSWFNNIYQHPFLYEDSTITLIDSGGIVIGRSSDSGKYIGKSSPDTEIIKTVLENKQGVTEATGLDGKLKIYGFHPLWPISGGAYIYVGVDKDSVLSRINESVIRNLLWLFLANSVGIALALIFSQKYFVSNLNKLIKATQKISKGQWDVRTGLTSDYGELAALGQAFDKMAQELGEREKAQKMAQEEILKERNFKESVIQSLPGIFYVITSDLKYLRVNRNHVKFTGYSEEEILKMSPLDLFEGDDAETISQAIKKVFSEDGVVTAEAAIKTQDGTKIPYLFTGQAIVLEGIKCLVGLGIDVSKQKEVERDLELERAQLISIFDSINQLITVIDPVTYELVFANKFATDFFGKDLSNGKCYELLRGRTSPCSICPNEKVISLGGAPYEWEFQSKKGRKYLMIIDRLIRWPDGRNVKFELAIDITDRRKAEETVRQNEELLRLVLETLPLGVWIADKNGSIIHGNKAGLKIWGDSGFLGTDHYGEFRGWRHDTGELIEPEGWSVFKAIRSGETCLDELIDIETFDGHKKVILNSSVPIRDETGTISGAIIVNQDVTERIIKDRALKETDRMMRSVIESSPIGIAVTDGANYVFCNAQLAKIFGYDGPGEIIGQGFEKLLAPQVRKKISAVHRKRISESHGPSNYETKGLRKNGQVFDINVWANVVDYEGGRGVLIFIVDLSESHKLRAQLLQAQKMEAIGTLAGGIAHDFNNLLAIISGYTELLLLRHAEKDPNRNELLQISEASKKASDLVKRLLTFSKKAEVHFRPVELNREVINIVSMLSTTISKMITIVTHLAEDLYILNGDSGQIGQALMNMCINAAHAMPDGGKLSIETANVTIREDIESPYVNVRPGSYVSLIISDTGHGVPKEYVDRIFEPFFTTKGTAGTGLGLSMVHGIVKNHQGYVFCDSKLGKGTTFTVLLPAVDEPAVVRSRPKYGPDFVGGSETILYVEDEEPIRLLWSEVLQRVGYRVLEADNGEMGLNTYKDNCDEISLVILDINMPVMGGRECMGKILEIDDQAKIVIASGYAGKRHVQELIKIGAKAYLAKPFDITEVLRTVRDVIDEKS